MPIKPGCSWCDAQDHHGAETSFAAARPRHPAGDGRARGREQDSSGGFTGNRVRGCTTRRRYRWRIAPVGVGLAGEGDGTSPALVSCVYR